MHGHMNVKDDLYLYLYFTFTFNITNCYACMRKHFLITNFSDVHNRTQFRCLGLIKDVESLDSYLFADACLFH